MMEAHSLTGPASVSKRKQACRSCRHRKRRCDGNRPVCALCQKWGVSCEYTVPAADRADGASALQMVPILYGAQPLSVEMGFSAVNSELFDGSGMTFDCAVNSTQESMPLTSHLPPVSVGLWETGIGSGEDALPDACLPSDDILLELVLLFFENANQVFPIFHKVTFIEGIQDQSLRSEAPSLLYAICTIASRYHADPVIRNQQRSWYDMSRFEYDLTPQAPDPGLRTIQAALLILTYACTIGEYSVGWLGLGKVWRQVCALGLNRLDSEHERFYGVSMPVPRTPLEREEYRRTLWLLFTADRGHSWPTGWPHAIDERHFMVNIPVADDVFQTMTPATLRCPLKSTPFTRNLDRLISSFPPANEPLNILHYICVVHVLLGRVSEQIHSLHESPDSPEYIEACTVLDEHIVRIWLTLPRAATCVLECPPASRVHAVWLNLILNTTAILLHYRCARVADESVFTKSFAQAVVAAQNTARIVKDATRCSTDILVNAHIGASLYVAACVLVIEWKLSGNDRLKADIDVFGLVFDRFYEIFEKLGLKFKLALEHDLAREKDSVLDLRERGFRGLLADCSKWSHVKAEAAARGVYIR